MNIGEGLSKVYNWMKGSELIDTQVKNVAGLRTVIDSEWGSFSGATYYVESKFGTSTLTSAQRIAQNVLRDIYHVEYWNYNWVGKVGAIFGNDMGIGISSTMEQISSRWTFDLPDLNRDFGYFGYHGYSDFDYFGY